jgi:glutamate N-acetyltransferase / amino-acid N-acetyltransferase
MTEHRTGVCVPLGFRAGAAAGHIKNPGSTRLDCALVASDAPAAVAGMFTTNRVRAACVDWNAEICAKESARAVFINSGNANACTGERGMADVRATADRVAAGLDIPAEEVCILSTGVIGVPLPVDRLLAGVDDTVAALSESGGEDAANAIMTTDTVPKTLAAALDLPGGTVHIGAMAKGAGMIAPDMATMLCVITTDAAADAALLKAMLCCAADASFNRMCIDNDTSTNDSVICLANGRSGVALVPDSEEAALFTQALTELCIELAKMLARDGEGATKLVEIRVEGAASPEDAAAIARAIGESQLCKTAFFGEDPNWGRFACAAGYSGADFDPADLSIWLDEVRIMEQGLAADYRERDAAAVMKKPSFVLRISAGSGPGSAVFWTADLSQAYVSINADYRT